eukprot:188602_1
MSTIKKIDSKLAEYYRQHSATYFDINKAGKFQTWCDDNGYDDVLLNDELCATFDEAMCYEFDIDADKNNLFPFNPPINDNIQKNKQVFEILKNILFHGHWKRYTLNTNDIQVNINESQIIHTIKLYTKYIKTWGNITVNGNMLHFLAVSLNNNLLMNIVDSLRREKVQWMINDYKNQPKEDASHEWMEQSHPVHKRVTDWISKCAFITNLNEKCKNANKNYSLDTIYNIISSNGAISSSNCNNNNQSKKPEQLSLETAVITYPKRIGDHLVLGQSHKIKDNLKIIATYIVVSGIFIKQLLSEQKKSAPFLLDFMLVFPPLISDHKVVGIPNDFYDHEIKKNEFDQHKKDVIGDICNDLKQTNCIYHETSVSDTVFENQSIYMDPIPLARTWIQKGLFGFCRKLKMNREKYPQYSRLNIIVDRRNAYDKKTKDPLILFEPPDYCNKIPKEQHPPELYFDLSRRCLIPRPESEEKMDINQTNSLDARDAANGQLMTFSYHVRAEDDIKCYLLWNQQCVRFYPEDILELLPHLFIMDKYNKKWVESMDAIRLVKQMEIPDRKFEKFYSALTNKKSNEFPKQYEFDDSKSDK